MGWIAAASATPAIMMITGVGFFGLSLAANQGISVLGMDPGAMAVAGVAAGAVTQVRLAPMGGIGVQLSTSCRQAQVFRQDFKWDQPASTRPSCPASHCFASAGVCAQQQVLPV
jgi:hypothetical protein